MITPALNVAVQEKPQLWKEFLESVIEEVIPEVVVSDPTDITGDSLRSKVIRDAIE